MKQIKKWSIYMLMLMAMPLMVACGSDDSGHKDSLGTYIIGNWHSYKATAYANGQSRTVDVDKTGEYSSMYIECNFQSGGTAIMKAWQVDANGLSHWAEETCSYTVNGDIVKISDSSGGTIDAVYDSNENALILRLSLSSNGVTGTANIYFRK